jgi:uncharacterized phage protein (TIGR01671 family)
MREIKYRAWNKDFQEMIYDSNERIFSNHLEENLMQYTGLLDKNGVEIYEGDIVKYNLSFPVGEIVFNRDRFIPIYDRSSYDEWELDFWRISDKCEVIGNIYENPELLDK